MFFPRAASRDSITLSIGLVGSDAATSLAVHPPPLSLELVALRLLRSSRILASSAGGRWSVLRLCSPARGGKGDFGVSTAVGHSTTSVGFWAAARHDWCGQVDVAEAAIRWVRHPKTTRSSLSDLGRSAVSIWSWKRGAVLLWPSPGVGNPSVSSGRSGVLCRLD